MGRAGGGVYTNPGRAWAANAQQHHAHERHMGLTKDEKAAVLDAANTYAAAGCGTTALSAMRERAERAETERDTEREDRKAADRFARQQQERAITAERERDEARHLVTSQARDLTEISDREDVATKRAEKAEAERDAALAQVEALRTAARESWATIQAAALMGHVKLHPWVERVRGLFNDAFTRCAAEAVTFYPALVVPDPEAPPHSDAAFKKYGHANCDRHEGCRKANAKRKAHPDAEMKP